MTMDTVTALHHVRKNTSIPVPHAYDDQSDYTITDIGARYMFMDTIPGRPRDQFGEDITEKELSVLIADSAVQLASLILFKIGRLYTTHGGQYEIGPFVNEDGTT